MTKRMGIERQALWLAMAPMVVLAILLDGYFVYFSFNEMNEMFHDRNQLIARQLVISAEYGVFSDNRELLQQQVNAALKHPEVKSVAVYNRHHQLLVMVGRLPDKVNQQTPLFEDAESMWIDQTIYPTQIQTDDMMASSVMALGRVSIEVSKHLLYEEKIKFLAIDLGLLALVLLGSLLIINRIAQRIIAPVLTIRNAVRQIAEGHFGERIVVQSEIAEFQELALGFNEMTAQLQIERVQLEQKIQEATLALRQKINEVEEANSNKTHFLAAASHDLRQPMHALGLFVGEMQNLLSSPEQVQVGKRIEKSVEALSGLLDSLLDVSKLDAGVVVPRRRDVNLNEILARLAKNFSVIAAEKNIRLRVRPTMVWVHSDPVLLERILGNLVSNAVRYTPRNGAIYVACRRCGERVKIEVRDSGFGIDPSEHQNIFREFTQLQNPERDRANGLGLGLAIVRRLLALLEHQLELKSALGAGSTFSIKLERVRIDDQAKADKRVGDRRSGDRLEIKMTGKRVLVVDDDILVQQSTQGVVESWGCLVKVAFSVAEAMKLCRSGSFDAVICDYRLPDGNGLQLVEYLRSSSATPPKFILISGDTAPEILAAVNQQGFNLLNKPVRPARLRSLLMHVLSGR